MTRKKANSVALMGMLVALSVGIVFLANMFSVSKLMPNGSISAIIIAIVICELGLKKAISFYLANIFLIFLIVPNKWSLIVYTFFGAYVFFKFKIEQKFKRLLTQLIMKTSYFVAFTVFNFIVINNIFAPWLSYSSGYYLLIGILILEVLFGLFFDYATTLCVYCYKRRFKKTVVDIKLVGEDDGNEKG